MKVKCLICGKSFEAKRYWQKFCSRPCYLKNCVNETRTARRMLREFQQARIADLTKGVTNEPNTTKEVSQEPVDTTPREGSPAKPSGSV